MAKVVIIGGGIVGAAAAHRLACSGHEVVVVDRADLGQASAVGAGMVAPATDLSASQIWYPLAFAAVASYPKLVAQLRDQGHPETGYEVVGALLTAPPKRSGELDRAQVIIEQWASQGAPNIGQVSRLAAGSALELFPALSPDLEAIHLSGAARVNGTAIRDALLAAVAERRGRMLTGTARLLAKSGTIQAVRVGRKTEGCDAVLLASGAWAAERLSPDLAGLPVYPQRGQLIHIDLPHTDVAKWPFVFDISHRYMVTFPSHRVVVGATREESAGFDCRLTALGVHEVLDYALRAAPGLAQGSIVDLRVGLRPMTADRLPLMGKIDGVSNLWIAAGLGPHGLALGPYVGQVVADALMGQGVGLDLTPFSPSRPQPARL